VVGVIPLTITSCVKASEKVLTLAIHNRLLVLSAAMVIALGPTKGGRMSLRARGVRPIGWPAVLSRGHRAKIGSPLPPGSERTI